MARSFIKYSRFAWFKTGEANIKVNISLNIPLLKKSNSKNAAVNFFLSFPWHLRVLHVNQIWCGHSASQLSSIDEVQIEMGPVIIVFIPWNYSGRLKNFLFNPCRKLAKRPFGQKCFFTITRNNWESPIVCVKWSWTDILHDLGLHSYSEREGDNVTQPPWTFWNLSPRLWS